MRGRRKNRDPHAGNILKQVMLQMRRLESRSEGEVTSLLNGSMGNFLSYRKSRKRKLEDIAEGTPFVS